jgi:putative tricarboxylic transport membrane protein
MRRLDFIGIGPYVVVLLIASYLYYQAVQISPGGEGRLGPDFWPKTILVFAIVTCAWEIVRKVFVGAPPGGRPGPIEDSSGETSLIPQGKPLEDTSEVGPFVPWMGIGLTAAYVFSFPWLGYFIATFLYVTAFVFLGNYRRPLVAACVGIAASLAFMFLFMRVVYVSLPIGVEPFAQLSTLLMRVMGIK